MLQKGRSRRAAIVYTLGFISLVSVALFIIGAAKTRNFGFWFLVWNLFLAWLPLVFANWLIVSLAKWPWLSWRPLLLTLFWLVLLPNSFYLTSDLIHLQEVPASQLLFDSVMIESFIINGLVLGYMGLHLVHAQLRARLRPLTAASLIGLILLLCSFAIYLGRDLRLNSWDLITSPAGVLFSISDLFVAPRQHFSAFTTTVSFFVLIGSFYAASWHISRLLRPHRQAAETTP